MICKKLGLAAVVLGTGLAVVHLSGLSSYTSTAFSKVSKTVKRQVPLEFEIERIRHEVEQLIPDMKKNFSVIAEEMVAVENLQKEVTVTRANLRQQKDNILTMTKDLETGATTLVYDGRPYGAEQVRGKLTKDFASYKICEAELRSKEQLLDAKERSMETAREQLNSMKQQKQELEIQIAELEAELKTVRLAQTRNKFHFDDSQLARCKATLAEIRTRLNVEKKTGELEANFGVNGDIPVEKKAKNSEELINEIRTHLNDSPRANGKVVAEKHND